MVAAHEIGNRMNVLPQTVLPSLETPLASVKVISVGAMTS